GPPIEVVGLVKDSNYVTVGEQPKPFIYRPFAQAYRSGLSVLVRTRGESTSALPSIRDALEALDPDLPALGRTTLDAATSVSVLPPQLAGASATLLGAVAVMVVAIGLYGLRSYLVRRRSRELGIRMALGAQPKALVWMVANKGLRWAAAGIVLGIVMSLVV